MITNKDKGTSVGFSKVTPESYDGKRFEGNTDEIGQWQEPKNEYILCAAIWYKDGNVYMGQPKNIVSGYVWCGRRHSNIIQLRVQLINQSTRRETSVQGFLTSLDRFVDRIEANKIAIPNNQVFGNLEGDELISEDLY